MSSGWRHSVRLSQARPKNAMVSAQTSARRLFALALAPALRGSKSKSSKSWAMKSRSTSRVTIADKAPVP